MADEISTNPLTKTMSVEGFFILWAFVKDVRTFTSTSEGYRLLDSITRLQNMAKTA